jgi:hypothetical protein
MTEDAADLARRLADNAEAGCRHYLGNGRREGGAWRVGDVRNTPGRSMFVRLKPSRGRPAGKWTDAATGEHGDLLDVIRESCGLAAFRDVVEEARRFLALPQPNLPQSDPPRAAPERQPAERNSSEAARRLFAASRPLQGTLGETYLRARGLLPPADASALRFHPRCYYKPDEDRPREIHPAIIAAVTDGNGNVTGVHRTWLCDGHPPSVLDRRAMGDLLGHGVRFGKADDVLVAGEGIETVLSLAGIMPAMPLVAALSAGHLGAFEWPDSLSRLYVVRDRDPAGDTAFERLEARAAGTRLEVIGLMPSRNDFNDDLRDFGADHLRRLLAAQLAPADAGRFLVG